MDEVRYAVVATINADGTPQQTVLRYALQGDAIVMNTGWGRLKDRNLQHDPRISFCIEDAYRYLTIRGTATLDDDQAHAQADVARIARRYTPVDRQLPHGGAHDNPHNDRLRSRTRYLSYRVSGFTISSWFVSIFIREAI